MASSFIFQDNPNILEMKSLKSTPWEKKQLSVGCHGQGPFWEGCPCSASTPRSPALASELSPQPEISVKRVKDKG